MRKVEIVLVEDNQSDADLTIRALKKKEIAEGLVHLNNGEEAIEYFFATGKYSDRNVNEMPKVILLDLNMPKVGGMEVLKRIKTNEQTKRIPVVVLTSSKEDKDIIEGYALGVNSYIVKPVGFEDFSRSVSDVALYWLTLNQAPV